MIRMLKIFILILMIFSYACGGSGSNSEGIRSSESNGDTNSFETAVLDNATLE